MNKILSLSTEQKKIISKTEKFVKDKLTGEGSGHDWEHVKRVFLLSKRISKEEKANLLVVSLAALLHDIADWKFQDNKETIAGGNVARQWLEKFNVDSETIDNVCKIVEDSSYKGSGVKDDLTTIEGKIVQDSDRLDAMGAIGIGRTFAYGGHMNREMYNPNIKVSIANSFEEYKKAGQTTINHFYEKLLLLKDRMNTKTGKTIAEKRHKYMKDFLNEFFAEWTGEK